LGILSKRGDSQDKRGKSQIGVLDLRGRSILRTRTAVGAAVVNVKTGPFEDDVNVAADKALDLFTALGTAAKGFVLNALFNFKTAAICAFVLINWHAVFPPLKITKEYCTA
jgi:hypothetical protein